MARLRKPPADAAADSPKLNQFAVELEVFQGPFDLLLQLIARRELSITEVSLASVTDEFIAHMRRVPDLSSATEFLVVAATLLDMKAASLLPQTDSSQRAVDEDLSARDLLFSRLLQYRAFRDVGRQLGRRLQEQSGSHPRLVPLEPQFADHLPELRWTTTAEELARIAAAALAQKPRPDEAEHVARIEVTLDEQLAVVSERLRCAQSLSFQQLIDDAASSAVVVTRFLAVLELYRRGSVTLTQTEPLAPLELSWTGDDQRGERESDG